MAGVNKPPYCMFLLRSYRCFVRAPHESRKVPAREAASDPNEHPVTEYLAPVIYTYYIHVSVCTYVYIYIYR